jgi:hypothetical protein
MTNKNYLLNIVITTFKTLIILLAFNSAHAATTINSTQVSGTWTLAGSPYLIQNNINIATTSSLIIEPGVDVIFQGFYSINVDGSLKASGTAALPITFKINDTLGWHNDALQNGGWNGIQFQPYNNILQDISILNYCIIKDTKYGSTSSILYKSTLLVYDRNLQIKNCEFMHNRSTGAVNVCDGNIIKIITTGDRNVVFDSCNIYENIALWSILLITNEVGSTSKILNSKLHHNIGATILGSTNSELTISKNEIYNNNNNKSLYFDCGTIQLNTGHQFILNNKIYNNLMNKSGAISCNASKTTIDNNLICNNNSDDFCNCGFSQGGGGIRVALNNSGGSYDSTFYIIRNNVIANNNINYYGGGIYVFDCKVKIMNNTIINNTASDGGAGVQVVGSNAQVDFKNNILHGNKNGNIADISQVNVFDGTQFNFDYNWMEKPYYITTKFLQALPIGDTTHNVIGNNPLLVNPTLFSGILYDATTKDFNLTQSSACIDKGDVVAAMALPVDYAGSVRIQGAKIDIGAFEVFKFPSGIDENNIKNLRIFPNPTSNNITISLNKYGKYNLRLMSYDGKDIIQKEILGEGLTLQLDNIPKGIYMLNIFTNNALYASSQLIKN